MSRLAPSSPDLSLPPGQRPSSRGAIPEANSEFIPKANVRSVHDVLRMSNDAVWADLGLTTDRPKQHPTTPTKNNSMVLDEQVQLAICAQSQDSLQQPEADFARRNSYALLHIQKLRSDSIRRQSMFDSSSPSKVETQRRSSSIADAVASTLVKVDVDGSRSPVALTPRSLSKGMSRCNSGISRSATPSGPISSSFPAPPLSQPQPQQLSETNTPSFSVEFLPQLSDGVKRSVNEALNKSATELIQELISRESTRPPPSPVVDQNVVVLDEQVLGVVLARRLKKYSTDASASPSREASHDSLEVPSSGLASRTSSFKQSGNERRISMFQKRRSYTGPDSTPPTYEAGSQDHMASQAPTIHKSISPHDNIGGDASLAMRRYSTYDKYNTSENTQVSPYSTLSKRTSVLGDAIMAAMGRAKSPSISSAGSAEAPKEPRSQEPRQRRRISVYDALFTPYPFPDDEVAIQTAYLAKSSSELGAQSLKSTPSSLDVQPNATSKISSRTRRSSGLAEPHSAYTSSHLPTGSSHLEPVLKTPSPGSSLCDVSRELTVPPAPAIPAIPAVPVVPVLLEPPDTNLLSVSIPLSASHSQSGSAVYLKQPAVLGGSASVSAPASTSHIASSPTGSLGRPGYNPEPTTPKKKKFSVRQLLSKLGVRSKNTKE